MARNAHSHRDKLCVCRAWLGMAPYEEPEKLTVDAYLAQLEIEPLTHCPVCDKRLLRREIPPATAHAPPSIQERYRRAA